MAEAIKPDKLTQWPGAFGAYKYSRTAMVKVIWPYIGILVAYAVIAAIVQGIFGSTTTRINTHGIQETIRTVTPIGRLLTALVGIYFGVLTTRLTLLAVKGKTYTNDLLQSSWSYYLRYLGLSILTGLACVGLFALFVVPFFVFAPRLVLAPYFLVDQDLGVVEAFKASWNQSKGHVSKIYGIIGANIAMAITIIVLVGFYFLLMYAAINAVLYFFITQGKGSKKVAAA